MSKEKTPETKARPDETTELVFPSDAKPGLDVRMARAMLLVSDAGYIAKRGEYRSSKSGNYDFVKAEDVSHAARSALAACGVAVYVEEEKLDWLSHPHIAPAEKDSYIRVCMIRLAITLRADGENMTIHSTSEGMDYSDGAKAIGKASTYALKYGLIRALQLSAGDDLDEYAAEERDNGRQHQTPKQAPYQQHVVNAPKITPAQVTEVMSLVEQFSDPESEARNMVTHFNVTEVADLTTLNANVAITTLKRKLAKIKAEALAGGINAYPSND